MLLSNTGSFDSGLGSTAVRWALTAVFLLSFAPQGHARQPASAGRRTQSSSSILRSEPLPEAPSSTSDQVTALGTPKRIALDELHVVQFPRHIREDDLKWLVPLTGAAITSFAFDEKTSSEVVSSNPSFNQTSRNISDGLRDAFIAAPVALFGLGALKHNDHARETGILGSEAMVDAYIVGYALKLASFRERPLADHSEGSFYRRSSGIDSSFVSGHSLTAWSSAAVLAEEYPGRWSRVGIYTLATGVSLTRVLGQEHFPSDVLLGSAAGWLIGHYVYRSHHRQLSVR